MSTPDQQKILERYKRNLQKLKEQAALFGMSIPLPLQNDIEFHEEKIKELQTTSIKKSLDFSDSVKKAYTDSKVTDYIDSSSVEIPAILPTSRVGIVWAIVFILAIIVSAIKILWIAIALIIAALIYILLKFDKRREVKVVISVFESMEQYWNTWEERIDHELTAKGFIKSEELQNLADTLDVDTRGLLGFSEDPLHLILEEYERHYQQLVIFTFVYNKRTNKAISYKIDSQGNQHAQRTLVLRSKYPPSRYEYSSEKHIIQKSETSK